MLEKVRALLKQAENRETFFKRIASFLPPTDWRYQLIEKAYNDAKDAFRDQEREEGGRYFEHLRAVAIIVIDYLRVRNYILIIVALLHDIVEDKPSWYIDRVKSEFGPEVALLVDYCSKPSKKYYSEQERLRVYHARFENAPRDFFLIKLSDRLHNMLTMWKCSPAKIKRKVKETQEHYLPYAEKQVILIHELEAALQELESPKNP